MERHNVILQHAFTEAVSFPDFFLPPGDRTAVCPGGRGGGNTGLGPGVRRGLKDSEVNTASYGPFRIAWLRPPPMQDIEKIK